MSKLKKKIMATIAFILCIAFVFEYITPMVAYTKEEENSEESQADNFEYKINSILMSALEWIEASQNKDGCWKNEKLINDSCYCIFALRENGYDVSDELQVINNINNEINSDILSHKIIASQDDSIYVDELIVMQNSDGGVGINEKYESDVYDTLLALEALGNLGKAEYDNNIEQMILYLISKQNVDGGWGINDVSDTDKALTVRILYEIIKYINSNQIVDINVTGVISKADEYLTEVENKSFNKESIEEKIYYELIRIEQGDYTNIENFVEDISDIQSRDGSFYENYYYTYLVVKYLNQIKDIEKLCKIEEMSISLNERYFEADTQNEVSGEYSITYETAIEKELKLITKIYDGSELVYSQEKYVILEKEEENIKEIAFSYVFNEKEAKTFRVETDLVDGEEISASTLDYYKVCDSEEKEFILFANDVEGENYNINLSWNDLSGEKEQYGYRILRSEDNGNKWETRSSWNGLEKVKVLNIYPSRESESYLKDWMNRVVDEETGDTAGKGLIEVETVYFDDYIANPDCYLKDSDGNYKYDVLFFGAVDSNNYKDLNPKSLKSVQNFIDSGRGVLFGHDTVCWFKSYFDDFAYQIGIRMDYNSSSQTESVSVVKEGFLTKFPWSISGNIMVATTHTNGQLAGGNLEGTVWMKLNDVRTMIDYSTGAKDDAYLVTNNQLGLIQTGHSSGEATDDECKVLANTLFYLKQLTGRTSAQDNSFYDIASPSKPNVSISLKEAGNENYSINTVITSKDFGTIYQYKVEAVPKSDVSETVSSNIVEAEARAGLRGFVILKTDSEASAMNQIQYDENGNIIVNVFANEDESAEYTIENLETSKNKYLHIFAVDNAGNISEELIYDLENNFEEFSSTKVTTNIEADKTNYALGETTYLDVSAKADFYKVHATGVVEIYDSKNVLVDTVESEINTEITSDEMVKKEFEWNIENLATGKYEASVKWYYGDTIISKDRTEFNIITDGEIMDIISTDKKLYSVDEKIKLTDCIYNNTTNTFEDNLKLIINIYEEEKEDSSLKKLTAQISTIAGGTSSYIEYLDARELGVGNYKIVAQLKNDTEIISSSCTSFSISDVILFNDNFKGAININKHSDKEQLFKYSVTNIGNNDINNITVRITVYQEGGESVGVIDKKINISAGETMEFSEIFNTEALKIDSYPVILSVITEDGQEIILANSGFEVNIINKYTVTFVNYDGTVIDTRLVEYGSGATAPLVEDKINDGKNIYEFNGWDKEFLVVTEDIVVKAMYKKIENSVVNEPESTKPGNIEPENTEPENTKFEKNTALQTATETTSGIKSTETDLTPVNTGDNGSQNFVILLIISSLAVVFIVEKKIKLERK